MHLTFVQEKRISFSPAVVIYVIHLLAFSQANDIPHLDTAFICLFAIMWSDTLEKIRLDSHV
jgi:hypothetical protein